MTESMVKPLKWNPFRAETAFGYYHIDDQTDRPDEELKGRPPFLLSGSRVDLSRHSTLAEAKACAQADYNRRILSAIDLEAHKALIEKLADKIEDLIAEFGDDPKAALECVSEYLQLRRQPVQEER